MLGFEVPGRGIAGEGGKMIDSDNKRDHHRMTIQAPAEYLTRGSSRSSHCMVGDLSATGMLLMTGEAIAEGSELRVKITPGHSITPPLEAEIETLRCTRNDDGQYEIACRIVTIL
jgi:hypothetical protein